MRSRVSKVDLESELSHTCIGSKFLLPPSCLSNYIDFNSLRVHRRLEPASPFAPLSDSANATVRDIPGKHVGESLY